MVKKITLIMRQQHMMPAASLTHRTVHIFQGHRAGMGVCGIKTEQRGMSISIPEYVG